MTKAKKKRSVVRILAIVLAVLMPVLTTVTAFAEPGTGAGAGSALSGQKKYASPDINAITGHGEEPEEISVSAGAEYLEKAWYEYVTYSEHAVASYRLNDGSRLLFYDPYTYTNALIMDVQFDAATTDFATMSSYSISHTTSKSISACVSSTTTDTNSIQTSGRDKTGTEVKNAGYTKTIYNHATDTTIDGSITNTNDYEYKLYSSSSVTDSVKHTAGKSASISAEEKVELSLEGGVSFSATESASTSSSDENGHSVSNNEGWLTNKVTNKTEYSDGYKTTTDYSGDDEVEYNTTSTTEGWSELSARITKTIGSSISNSKTWSETESTTITKTYAATHFASDGVTPLPWAIVHYTVQMPMKCCLQVKYSGEWVTVSTIYCLLTTVQGTCRAWMQNGQVYYEDWGNGEPVVATDFWGQFMTKDQLMQAYQDKLYPTGGAES